MEGTLVTRANRRSEFVSGELLRTRWSSLESRRRWRPPRSIVLGAPLAVLAVGVGMLLSPRGKDVGASPRQLAVAQPAPLAAPMPALKRNARLTVVPEASHRPREHPEPISRERLAELEAWYRQLELQLSQGRSGPQPGTVIHHSMPNGYIHWWMFNWMDTRDRNPEESRIKSMKQLRDLRSGNPLDRWYAQRSLLSKPEYWHDPSFLENCVHALRDDDISRNLTTTVTWFENFPDQIASARELLIEGMWSQDPQLEFNAAYLLSFLEPGDELPRVCSILINHLADNDIAWDAVVASEALGRIGPRTVPYLQAAYPGRDEQQLSVIEHLLGHLSDDPRGWRRTIIPGVLAERDPVMKPSGAGSRSEYWTKR